MKKSVASYSAALFLTPIIGGVFVVCVLVFMFGSQNSASDLSKFPTMEDVVLKDRTIVDFAFQAGGVVTYSYLGASVPTQLSPQEIVELRDEISYTEFVAVDASVPDPLYTLNTRFYSQPTFAQDIDGSWRYLEYATTTRQAFEERNLGLWDRVVEVLVRSAYADTLSPFSGAGDGDVSNSMSVDTGGASPPVCTWSTVRTAATGNNATPVATSFSVGSSHDYLYEPPDFGTCLLTISRGFLPFDTSALGTDATISAVTLSAYVTATQNDDNDGNDYITVSTSTQATHTTLASADFDTAGPVTMNTASEAVDSGQRKDISLISISAYLTFTFNAAGVAAIKKSGETSTCTATTGVTCLSLREGHDANNDAVLTGTYSTATFSTSEATGTSQDPYLTITYTAPASTLAARGSLKIIGGGSLKITGGGVIIK